MSRHRLQARESRDRRKLKSAIAAIGEQWERGRDGRLYEADGYETFEEWCRAVFPAMCSPSWNLTPDQTDRLIAEALELASKRRRKAGLR